MKRCPKCQQLFYDDYQFCLTDGCVLVELTLHDEQETVIRPIPSSVESFVPKKTSVILIGTILTLASLLAVFVGLWIFRGGSSSDTQKAKSNTEQELIEQQKANLKNQQAELELEKKRLSDERNRQEKEKTEVDSPILLDSLDPPPARITFKRGSIQETQTGVIVKRREYLLRTLHGQLLEAEVVSSGSCVVFSNGTPYLSYSTKRGDNRLILRNNCRDKSDYRLTTTVQ